MPAAASLAAFSIGVAADGWFTSNGGSFSASVTKASIYSTFLTGGDGRPRDANGDLLTGWQLTLNPIMPTPPPTVIGVGASFNAGQSQYPRGFGIAPAAIGTGISVMPGLNHLNSSPGDGTRVSGNQLRSHLSRTYNSVDTPAQLTPAFNPEGHAGDVRFSYMAQTGTSSSIPGNSPPSYYGPISNSATTDNSLFELPSSDRHGYAFFQARDDGGGSHTAIDNAESRLAYGEGFGPNGGYPLGPNRPAEQAPPDWSPTVDDSDRSPDVPTSTSGFSGPNPWNELDRANGDLPEIIVPDEPGAENDAAPRQPGEHATMSAPRPPLTDSQQAIAFTKGFVYGFFVDGFWGTLEGVASVAGFVWDNLRPGMFDKISEQNERLRDKLEENKPYIRAISFDLGKLVAQPQKFFDMMMGDQEATEKLLVGLGCNSQFSRASGCLFMELRVVLAGG